MFYTLRSEMIASNTVENIVNELSFVYGVSDYDSMNRFSFFYRLVSLDYMDIINRLCNDGIYQYLNEQENAEDGEEVIPMIIPLLRSYGNTNMNNIANVNQIKKMEAKNNLNCWYDNKIKQVGHDEEETDEEVDEDDEGEVEGEEEIEGTIHKYNMITKLNNEIELL